LFQQPTKLDPKRRLRALRLVAVKGDGPPLKDPDLVHSLQVALNPNLLNQARVGVHFRFQNEHPCEEGEDKDRAKCNSANVVDNGPQHNWPTSVLKDEDLVYTGEVSVWPAAGRTHVAKITKGCLDPSGEGAVSCLEAYRLCEVDAVHEAAGTGYHAVARVTSVPSAVKGGINPAMVVAGVCARWSNVRDCIAKWHADTQHVDKQHG